METTKPIGSTETKKKLIFKAGYNVECVSWENDADNYKTNVVHCESLEIAQGYLNLCKICGSKGRNKNNLGNTYDSYTSTQIDSILNFINNNLILFPELKDYDIFKYKDIDEIDPVIIDDCIDYFNETQRDLLGYSDDYVCRVCERATILYSDKDIYVDVLESI